jgi:HD-GYP domain-containing protein (c-di-GMP phosphodiesterase class II)
MAHLVQNSLLADNYTESEVLGTGPQNVHPKSGLRPQADSFRHVRVASVHINTVFRECGMESGQKEEMVTQYQSAGSDGRVAERANTETDDLRKWNDELEMYVQEQTIELTRQNQEYAALCKKMKHSFRDFTITISNLIELRDKTVASHSNNVALLSVGLAKKIGLNDEETETVAVAAQLHDIGKR